MAPLDTLLNLTFIILVSDFYFFVVLCVIPVFTLSEIEGNDNCVKGRKHLHFLIPLDNRYELVV